MKKTIYAVVALIILALALWGVFVYFNPEEEKTTPNESANLGEGVVAEMIDSQVSTSTLAKLNMGTLDRQIVAPDNAADQMFEKNEAIIKDLVSGLRTKPEVFSDWNDLGTYRKIIGDYVGAKEAWENAAILRPKSALPLGNLGNLYGYYVKDSAKAEEYYLAAIKIEPTPGFWYYQTYFFYKEAMNDSIKAKNIVTEGVKANPLDADLKALLKSL